MDGRVWRVDRRTRLHWRRLDDAWLAFDAGSDDTHHFDSVSAAALMCLEAEPLALGQLAATLARELDLPAGEGLATRLESLLAQLSELGLIEPVAP